MAAAVQRQALQSCRYLAPPATLVYHPSSAAMAAKKYIDADGDFSRYLQMSDLGSHLVSASSEAEHNQAAANDFLSLTIGGPHYQAPPNVAVRPPQMLVIEQAGHGGRDATLVPASPAGGSAWTNGQLHSIIVESSTVPEVLHESGKHVFISISSSRLLSIYCYYFLLYITIYMQYVIFLLHTLVREQGQGPCHCPWLGAKCRSWPYTERHFAVS